MAYIRFGLQKPRAGQFDAVKSLQDRVVAALKETPGCTDAWVLLPTDDSGEIGRLSIWDAAESAEAAAQRAETMALRSQIGILVDGPGIERGFSL